MCIGLRQNEISHMGLRSPGRLQRCEGQIQTGRFHAAGPTVHRARVGSNQLRKGTLALEATESGRPTSGEFLVSFIEEAQWTAPGCPGGGWGGAGHILGKGRAIPRALRMRELAGGEVVLSSRGQGLNCWPSVPSRSLPTAP